MDHGLKIIIWNVRVLNARARHTAIRSLVVTTDASIVCFQETKMEFIYLSTVLDALGSEFDEYVYLPHDRHLLKIYPRDNNRSVIIYFQVYN